MIINQAYLFLIFVLVGGIIGLLFDFFRILRKSFKTNDILTYIQDIIFWILTGIIILFSIFIFNNGAIRFFMFVGLLLGVIFYLLIFSKYIIKICIKIIELIKTIILKIYNIFLKLLRFLYKLFNKIFFRPFRFLLINLTSKIKQIKQFSTKIKQFRIKKCKKEVKN